MSTPMPNADRATIPPGKLEHYLLNVAHATGGGKARFFRSLGYDAAHPEAFRAALLAIATEEVAVAVISPHGTKYLIDGYLQTPGGRRIRVRTIWIVEPLNPSPRLVTAYPAPATPPTPPAPPTPPMTR